MPDHAIYAYDFYDADIGAYRIKLRFQTPGLRLVLIDNKPGWTMRAEHLYLNGRVVEDEVIKREYRTKAAALDDIESLLIEAGAISGSAFVARVARAPDDTPDELHPDPSAHDPNCLWLDYRYESGSG